MMNFKIIFIAFLFSIAAVAQNTLIPDLIFEQNLITQGIDSGAPDGKVLTANINSLKTLNISNERFLYSRIKDLTGIEDFLALENLNCSYNELKNLDLSKNIAITTLDCSRNNLTQINVSLNTNLVSLECSYNRLSVLNITDNRLLETFICEFNYLTSLNLTNNINLKTLSTGYNRLINIDVSKNILLEKFRCYFNLLIDLDLSKNINIIEVFCGYNKIIRLDLSINKKLEVFSCISNSLTYLNLKNGSNTNLRYISQNSSQPNSSFAYNPDLRCIIVDDLAYSSQKWNNLKDATTGYTQLDYASTIIQSPQVFCVANNQNLNDIVTNYGTLLTWFTTETGSISLPKTTLLTNGMTYYASLTTVSCERRTAVKIFIGSNIKPIPTLTTLPDIIGDCHTNITTIPTATAFCTGLITATTTNPLAYTIPGTYTIVWNYNDGNGNTETQNQKIIISPQPLPIATATQTFCVGQNKTLAAIQILNGINTKWYSDNSNNIVLSNNAILTDQSIYYLSQTINTCESNRIAIKTIIEDTQKPIPTLATLPTITGDCHTQITTIPTATDACAGVITATTASPLRYTLPGTYTIVWNYDDGNGNSITQNQTVNISAQPLPVVTSPQTFCVQQNATLSDLVISGQNSKWYNALTAGNSLVNTTLLQNNNTYYASQTINGCESQRVAVLVTIQNTTAPIGIATQTFCSNPSPDLNSFVVNGTDLKWYDNNGNNIQKTTPLANATTYYATQTVNNCESINKTAVTATLITSLSATDFEDSFCDDLNQKTKTIDLTSYNSKLITLKPDYNFSYYNSKTGAENELQLDKITSFTNYKLIVGENKIYVRINSATACNAVVLLKINLFERPIIPIKDNLPICENNSILVSAGENHSTYNWSTGSVTASETINSAGQYWVAVTQNHTALNCLNRKDFGVVLSNKPIITAIETTDWTTNNNTITVHTTGNGDYKYAVTNEIYQDNNQFTGLKNGKHIIYVEDKNGCGTANKEVFLLMYPTFFTPNGDGYNDRWFIQFSDFNEFLGLKIHDRYGKLIKTFDSNSNDWDGKLNGNDLPADDYWFTVNRTNGKELKGHFSLKR